MRVELDGHELPSDARSIAQGLELASAEARRIGRLIVEASLNERSLSQGELCDPSEALCGGVLRIGSVPAAELALETVHHGLDALDQIEADQGRCADLIARSDLPMALKLLEEVLASWQQIETLTSLLAREPVWAMSSRRDGGIGTDRGPVCTGAGQAMGQALGQPMGQASPADTLASSLRTVRDAVVGQDWSSLSDALVFELPECVGLWRRKLMGVADALRERMVA